MDLGSRKKLIARMLDVGIDRVWIDPNRLDEVKEAITRADLHGLIHDLAVQIKHKRGISSFRRRSLIRQRRKGRRHGKGSLKGKRTARLPRKTEWINKVRLQRLFLNGIKERKLIASKNYRMLRLRVKGGFFRNLRHLKNYIEEHKLIKKNGTK